MELPSPCVSGSIVANFSASPISCKTRIRSSSLDRENGSRFSRTVPTHPPTKSSHVKQHSCEGNYTPMSRATQQGVIRHGGHEKHTNKEYRVLGNDGHAGAQSGQPNLGDIHAINLKPPLPQQRKNYLKMISTMSWWNEKVCVCVRNVFVNVQHTCTYVSV